MSLDELRIKFEEANNYFSSATQAYLASSNCDADTRYALDEIARQTFYAIAETQSAILQYLQSN